jgi:hypothetical protein
VIERDWYRLGTWRLTSDGRFVNCDTPLPGVFDGPLPQLRGHPGDRPLAVVALSFDGAWGMGSSSVIGVRRSRRRPGVGSGHAGRSLEAVVDQVEADLEVVSVVVAGLQDVPGGQPSEVGILNG